jgi:peptide/nickel transport system substrate-binding protein
VETIRGIYPNRHRWLLAVVALTIALILACGTAAPPEQPEPPLPTSVGESPTSSGGDQPTPAEQPTPTPVPQATSTPSAVTSGRNKVVVVTEAEPASVGTWSEGCSGEIHSMGCQELTQDYIGWIDTKTLEPVLLSGFTKYEMIEPNRWRYTLREGVKFHNGEPWNAEAAKLGLDWNGVGSNPGNSLSYTGVTTGEVVDELTVDVVCEDPCPIFPRTGIFTEFVAPQWWATASEEEKSTTTNGFGPYRIIEYNPGVSTEFEAYEDYIPSDAFDAQAPTIQFISHTYRAEATVRAAMLIAGEADWAADIGFEEKQRVPQAKQSGTTEVYTLVLDVMWHPELQKQKVRLALAHAIDCQGLLDSLLHGEIQCHAAIAPPGSVGITPENSKPREYNPDLARQLLQEAGYDPANEINVNTRPGSNVRGLELMEAVVTYWRDVGVNSNLNAWGDLAKAREIQLSGCGQFTLEPGYKEKLDCAQREPPEPYFASSHAYEIATSDEILDMQRQGQARLGCFGRSSRVCFPDLQRKIETASATPPGPERTRLMTEVADISYNEVYFIPLFAVQMVYGLSDAVEWEPLYAPRFRGNTMRFKQ